MSDGTSRKARDKEAAGTWETLAAWIRAHGGHVHPALTLRCRLDNDDDFYGERGVWTTAPVAVGETLLRVPSALAVDGRNMPATYAYAYHETEGVVPVTTAAGRHDSSSNNNDSSSKEPAVSNTAASSLRHASPWLRCVAAWYRAASIASSPHPSSSFSWWPYYASLPTYYETVATAWTHEQATSFLAGTSSPAGTAVGWQPQPDGGTGDHDYARYQRHVRPYLVATGVLRHDSNNNKNSSSRPSERTRDGEFAQFRQAVGCISTRGFHMAMEDGTNTHNDSLVTTASHPTTDESTTHEQTLPYTGPFLVPAVDLLNHAATGEDGHVTTLHWEDDGGCFVMKASVPIAADTQIRHSYGDALTAGQFLQTFGFVPATRVERALALPSSRAATTPSAAAAAITTAASAVPPLDGCTPALLRKMDILEAAWKIIADGHVPQRLAAVMQDMEDEVWALAIDRNRTADFVPDDLIVDGSLSDELVTAACVAFSPVCAYREAASALLGAEILQDFYLGHLACTSLLQVIQAKLSTYTPITWQGQVYTDDAILLRQLFNTGAPLAPPRQLHDLRTAERRLAYGLTVRLEEKACVLALRRNIMNVLSGLEEDLPPSDSADELVSKKPKRVE